MTRWLQHRALVQGSLAAVLALALVALVAFAVHVTQVTTRTFRPAGSSSPATAPTPVAPDTPLTPPAPVVPAMPAARDGSNPAAATAPGRHQATTPSASPAPTTPTPGSSTPPVPVSAIGRCPVAIARPADIGGVQSLVSLAPAFGPFSAEAFAAAAAYQPELELLGPILAQYPKLAEGLKPALRPLLALFGSGASDLFDLIAPLYSPHRAQLLKAETKLASELAPASAKLAATPLAGCVVDLEAALVGDTKRADAHRASVDAREH